MGTDSNEEGDLYVAQTKALVDLLDLAVAALDEAVTAVGEETSMTAHMLRSACAGTKDVRGRFERRLVLLRGEG